MKTILLNLSLFAVFFTHSLHAADSERIKTQIANPSKANGIHIGDVLTRNISIDAYTGQRLLATSIPVKGSRIDGIELVGVDISSEEANGGMRHRLSLKYQVFADASTPIVMKLPEASFQLTNGQSITVPSWHFWFSPLVNTTLPNVMLNLQPQALPPMVEDRPYLQLFFISMLLLTVSIVGLIYINVDKPWLPFMGGAFSRSYRKIKQLTRSKEQDRAKLKQVLVNLHSAFNETYGKNVFLHNIDDFLVQHPQFRTISNEIHRFFAISNETLFSRNEHLVSELVVSLTIFSKNLRNLERGI